MATKKETKKPVKKAAKEDKAPSKTTAAKPAKRKVAAKADPKPAALDFPIVGIGASAGGLEALETFLSHMPETPGIAFVIIQHLSPKHKSIMGSLLGKYTKMPVLDIEDGMRIEAGHVYLNPPDKNVVLMGGHLQLLDPIRTGGVNLPIDVFSRSMAEELGEKAICMILSDTATDGTLGLKAVKGEGGMAMVQDPETAKYRGMPDSAAATGMVDCIHPAEELPEALVKYIKSPYVRAPRQAAGREEETSNQFRKILAVIRSATGHDFSQYKENTIRRRVERRMAVHQIHEIKDYVRYVQQTPSEAGILFKDMLIGVTRFFRDPEAFTALAQEGLPALLKTRAPNSPLRAWVVGCATGEEAYSLAILLHEAVRALSRPMDIQVFASDIDADAVETARAGVYPVSIAADVSEARLEECFVKEDNAYRVKKHIRERVVFAVQDVTKDPPFSRIDLLSMRNLLIYMQGDLQKRLLPLVHYALNPKGLLFLGPSETIGEFTDHYEVIDNKWKLFRRREVAGKRPVQFPGAAPSHESGIHEPGPSKATREVLELHEVAERVILDQYAPAGVLVDGTHEILHFMGKTDRYLETPVGKPSFQLLKMAREGIRAKLGPALSKALRQKKEVALEALQVPYNGHVRSVDVTVRPLTEAGVKGDFCLVLFEEKTPPAPAAPTKAKKGKTKRDPAKVQLEQELAETRENLQSTIEKLETANELLKSANEEAYSANEELQSTNEELKTFETQRVSKAGKTIDVRLTMTALSDETGKPAVISTTERDVTGRDSGLRN